MKKMKKVLASLLAATMVVSMSFTAFADESSYVRDGNPEFTKTYKATNTGTVSPEETFTFTFTDPTVINYSDAETLTAPSIPDSTVTFDAGAAGDADKMKQAVAIALTDIKWPGVGVYTYKVTETPGDTAGVTYSTAEATLKVTVAFSEGTNTYYAAFVTLTTADENNDGITDKKVAGFENEYAAGSLAINKTVTGNMGDQSKYFTVTVKFNAPTDKTVDSDIYYTASTADGKYSETTAIAVVADQDAEAEGVQGWTGEKIVTIQLKHDDTITFTNIPYGVTYKVEEDDYVTNDGYDAATYSLNKATAATTAISGEELDSELETVDIVNKKDTTVDTGIILDSAPYVLLLALAAVGMFAVVNKKREDEI